MTSQEADALIARQNILPIEHECLVGFELISQTIAPEDTQGRIALAKMIRDADGSHGRRSQYRIAHDTDNRLTFWTLPSPTP